MCHLFNLLGFWGFGVLGFWGLAFYFNLSKKAKVYTYDSSSIPKSEEIKNSDYSLDKIEKVVGSSKFKVPALGLEMNVLDSWKSIDSESVELPDGFDTPQFLFKKEGTSCIFSYALATESIFQQYKQISWADRVYTKEGQYDSSWYLLKELIPQGFEFLGHDRKPFSKEVRLISDQNLTMYISKGVRQLFLLFSENGGQVSYDCDKDVSSMLATVEHNKYDEQTLDDSKKGVAFFVSKMKDGAYRGSQFSLEKMWVLIKRFWI
jgi:hypothetical protein